MPGKSVFVGDYNLHVEDDTDGGAGKFLDVLNSYVYKQIINQPTHRLNGTLDLIFTTDPSKVKDVDVYTRLTKSDQDPIVFLISVNQYMKHHINSSTTGNGKILT